MDGQGEQNVDEDWKVQKKDILISKTSLIKDAKLNFLSKMLNGEIEEENHLDLLQTFEILVPCTINDYKHCWISIKKNTITQAKRKEEEKQGKTYIGLKS